MSFPHAHQKSILIKFSCLKDKNKVIWKILGVFLDRKMTQSNGLVLSSCLCASKIHPDCLSGILFFKSVISTWLNLGKSKESIGWKKLHYFKLFQLDLTSYLIPIKELTQNSTNAKRRNEYVCSSCQKDQISKYQWRQNYL